MKRRTALAAMIAFVIVVTAAVGGYATIAAQTMTRSNRAQSPAAIAEQKALTSPAPLETKIASPTPAPPTPGPALKEQNSPERRPTPSPTATRIPRPTPAPRPTATSTPLIPASPTPAKKTGEELQIAPELQDKVEGRFTYSLKPDYFTFQLTARNLSQKTITGMTIQYCLEKGAYAFCFSPHSLPAGRLKLAPNESSLVFQDARVGFGTDPAKYGKELSEAASSMASDISAWKVRIKVISLVAQ